MHEALYGLRFEPQLKRSQIDLSIEFKPGPCGAEAFSELWRQAGGQ